VAVDLHIHSNKSDGSDSPAAVVRGAVAAGLTGVALTDHDNLNGLAEAAGAAEAAGITFVPGTELSVNWAGSAMHMLVYFLEPGPGPLQDELGSLQQGRKNRNFEIVEKLNALGLEVSYEEIVEEAEGGGIGRPHFAAVLVRKGYVSDIQQAFDQYLATGRPGYVGRRRLDAADAVRLARLSGAVPVIAHPHTIGISESDYSTAFASLVEVGLGGIEAHYAEYAPELRRHLAALCEDYGIVPTGGSDYHGTYKVDLSIGTGRGDLNVPDETIGKLQEERDSR
jgi:predicted metal-dependent phosphoesterase TrpH